MSLRDWLFGTGEDPQGRPTEESLAPLGATELARIEEASTRSLALRSGERLAAAVDQLVPLGATWGQAAATRGLAVVKFPEGVTWADLCVRQSDGWNLLSSFNKETGKFNKMAGIKQAGLQPQAVANIALQSAAVAVGMAYMNEINDKLEGLQEGIEEIQRVMERQRDARLKAGYDALYRLSLNLGESPPRRASSPSGSRSSRTPPAPPRKRGTTSSPRSRTSRRHSRERKSWTRRRSPPR